MLLRRFADLGLPQSVASTEGEGGVVYFKVVNLKVAWGDSTLSRMRKGIRNPFIVFLEGNDFTDVYLGLIGRWNACLGGND